MAKRARDPVQFTLESAERIARVVREAETAPPQAAPLTFEKRFPVRVPRQVRAATFSGAWPIGSTKNVTFKYAPTATANVVNMSWPLSANGYANEDCLVGSEGTSWWLVVPVLQTATAVFVTATATASVIAQAVQQPYCSSAGSTSVVSGISLSASLNTSNCSITINQTVTTASVRVVTGTATASFITATATAAVIASAFTSSFIRVRVP